MNMQVAQLSFCQRVVDAARVRTDKEAMMVIGPEAAFAGTLNEREVAETMPNAAAGTATPPIVTSGRGDFSFNPVPRTVMVVLVGPEPGEKLVMLGRMRKVLEELAGERAVPPGGWTVITPVEAPAGTETRMVVLFEIV